MADEQPTRLRDLVARQLGGDPAASDTETVPVTFRRTGDQVDVTLRRLSPSEQRQARSYALFGGETQGDIVYLLGVAAVRFAAVDDQGRHEFSSYDDVVAFQNAITETSWDALGHAMVKLRPTDAPVVTPEDPEAGKGS